MIVDGSTIFILIFSALFIGVIAAASIYSRRHHRPPTESAAAAESATAAGQIDKGRLRTQGR